MIEYDPDELADLLFRKHANGKGSLADQPHTVQVTYRLVADTALDWFVTKTLDREGSAVEVAASLAEELALKYNHPGWFVDGVRDTFDRYAELVGEENLSDEIRKARKL